MAFGNEADIVTALPFGATAARIGTTRGTQPVRRFTLLGRMRALNID